jgi:tetratricopeptide (TPR) repeat protein
MKRVATHHRAFGLLCLLSAVFAVPAVGGPALAPATIEAARLNNLGTALMNQQLLERAAKEFDKAYAADPSLTAAKTNAGLAFYYLQRLPEAKAALEAAAKIAPNDPHTWYALALVARVENEPAKSRAYFERVLALDPKDADTWYFVGMIDMEAGDLPRALLDFRHALEINPLHASAQFGLARCLQRQGKTEPAQAALASFQHITAAKIGYPVSHIYGEEGRYAHAEDAAIHVSAVSPAIAVKYNDVWHSAPTTRSGVGASCIIRLDGKQTIVALGSGRSVLQLLQVSAHGEQAMMTALPAEGLPENGTAEACAAGDYDNDGQSDLALVLDGSLRLFRNMGHNRFAEVTEAAGVKAGNHPTSLTFVDYDHDGDLDLLVTGDRNVLLRNNGNGTFTDWTAQAAVGGTGATAAAALSDLNNDRAIDLITAGAGPSPIRYMNRREGPFDTVALYAARLAPPTSVVTFDFDKDGWSDVLVTHAGAPGVSLWRNLKGSGFERVALPWSDVLSASSAIPIDFDNDGWIDIAAVVNTAKGPELRMLRNLGPEGFTDVSAKLGLGSIRPDASASLIAADLTNAGAEDLLVSAGDGSKVLLKNIGGNKNHSLRIQLRGLADNKGGVGTKVEVFANGLWQKWEVTDQREILAGLGAADHPELIRLLWPTGVPQDEIVESAVPHGFEAIDETDRRGSSCPTLFSWNGKRYSFVTDVIGAGVVGHWVSPTQRNIPDPDEWVKVPGDQLRARDGFLSLRFGEPMEEVNFVDQVRLVAVDHPVSTAVYPNEGFLSAPPFAQEKTIVAASAHPLAAAHDANGNDVLALLSAPVLSQQRGEAPRYVRDFENLPYAGFANLHALTLDLGPYSAAKPLRLLLHGFVEYFSASSMYAAWQAGLTPIPPMIEAQAGDGSWHKVVEDMGFPAGLPRTVVVDLTGKLPAGARKLRMTTNLQIYWDQILVDNEAESGAAAPPVRSTELSLAKATLAFRGYPKQIDGRTPGDLTYDYQQMSPTGPFLPHRGAYTRYGDVTDLLRSVDDKPVVFGTGEDMDLEFSAAQLPPLPAGWSRDYFFYANGFVKDMDFYEASPFQVGQLPFHGMSDYPYPDAEHFPEDPAHLAYQLEYNTRWEPGFTARSFEFHYQPQAVVPETPRQP